MSGSTIQSYVSNTRLAEQTLQKEEVLKRNPTSQQTFFTEAKSQSEAAVKTSLVREEIAKSGYRLFTEGELAKSCMIKVCVFRQKSRCLQM